MILTKLKGKRVSIRQMSRPDVDVLFAMPRFSEFPDFFHNLPKLDAQGRGAWFEEKQNDPARLECIIENEESRIVGRINLRDIVEGKTARIGITLGSPFVDKGYGTEAMSLFMTMCFDHMGLEELRLEVIAYSKRAIHVYQKLGFQHAGEFWSRVSDKANLSFLTEQRFKDAYDVFRLDTTPRQIKRYRMTVTRDDFNHYRNVSIVRFLNHSFLKERSI